MPPSTLRVSVYWQDARGDGALRELCLPVGATAGDAVRASGLQDLLPDSSWQSAGGALRLALHGRACLPTRVLDDGDRVDITRALQLDPKEARRLRARAAAARSPASR